MRPILAAWVPLVLAVAGCASFGDHSPRATPKALPDHSLALLDSRRSGTHSHQLNPDWWQDFNSPVLTRLITTALAENPDLKAASARLQQAQAMVDAQAAELYPTIDANVSFSAQRFSANSTQARLAGEQFRQLLINPLMLRYHLDFWGRDQAALEAAVGKSLAINTELAEAKLLLSSAIAGSYFDLMTACEKLKVLEGIKADQEALLNFHKARLDTGLATVGPVLQAKIALQDAQQLAVMMRTEINLQKNLLATLAGKTPEWSKNTAFESLDGLKPIVLPAKLPLNMLANRPDLIAARYYMDAAAQEIKVAETAFYPDVNLVAFTGLHSVSMTDVLLQGSSLAYAVGPSINFPIFEGGRLRARLNYQEAAYDQAVERYNSSLLHSIQEVADALTRWNDVQARLSEQTPAVLAAAEAERLADSLRRNGLNNRSDILQANLNAHLQHLKMASLTGLQLKINVQLIKALGGGYHPRNIHAQDISHAN